ncbi:MAG: VCBS repeat-containing protein [Bacteroidia bacterium]
MKIKIVFIFLFTLISFADGYCQQLNSFFTVVDSEKSGIKFSNYVVDTDSLNMINHQNHWNGGGVAIGDLDNDGLSEVFFSGNQEGNRLYKNLGNLRFTDISEKADIVYNDGWNTGVSFADVNADGYLDIYVCRSGYSDEKRRRNLLLINNKDMTFSEQALKYGLADSSYSIHSAFFDYDNDGDLDVYILNNQNRSLAVTDIFSKQKMNELSNDRLMRNDNGYFTDVSKQAGIVLQNGLGLGIAASDFNNDGNIDIYIANDLMKQDYYLVNNGDGTFSNQLESAFAHVSMNSMGCDAADINNDLLNDLIVADMFPEEPVRQKTQSGITNDHYEQLVSAGYYHQFVRNVLQLNQGDNNFSDIAHLAGVAHTDWSWSTLFADFNNDGFKDLFIANSLKKDMLDSDFQKFAMDSIKKANPLSHSRAFLSAMEKMKELRLPNYLFQNNKDLTFSKLKDLGFPCNTNGAAYGDLDNDGDLDMVWNNFDTLSFVIENTISGKNYLKINLEGDYSNPFAYGARVIAYCGSIAQQMDLMPSRGFQSSVEPVLLFGLDTCSQVDSLIIRWERDDFTFLKNINANKLLKIKFNEVPHITNYGLNTVKADKLFEVTENYKGFKHFENLYDDFKSEPLLIRKISSEGPSVCVSDINADGLEDFFVSGTETKKGSFFMQTPGGDFNIVSEQIRILTQAPAKFYRDDAACIFVDINNDMYPDLIKSKGGNENNLSKNDMTLEVYINDGKGYFNYSANYSPAINENASALAAADFDNDGDVDLFFAGRSVPGKYPVTPRSFIFQNDNSAFRDVTLNLAPGLDSIGLVTSAIWSDYDNDSKPDLIIVGEFMQPVFYKNSGKALKQADIDFGETTLSGWWNSIVGGDFDNDGDTDYILANWGLNSRFSADEKHPLTAYYADFDVNGSTDAVMSYYLQDIETLISSRDAMLEQMGSLRKVFINYLPYAKTSPTEFLNRYKIIPAIKSANQFKHVMLENKSDGKFIVKHLPVLSQSCMVTGIVTDDYNADGFLDLLITGNSEAIHSTYGKQDACPGYVLINDGKGSFNISMPKQSGFYSTDNNRGAVRIYNSNCGCMNYITASNDSGISLLKLSQKTERTNYVDQRLKKKGDVRKIEYYYGEGYMSQSSPFISVPKK